MGWRDDSRCATGVEGTSYFAEHCGYCDAVYVRITSR